VVPELLAWMLTATAGPTDDRGLPVAVAVLTAAAIGHDMPEWIDHHGGTASADLSALIDVC
jgi:glycerol-3-phosphate acyltransferase PlsY